MVPTTTYSIVRINVSTGYFIEKHFTGYKISFRWKYDVIVLVKKKCVL